jgi:hypothetical protein
MWKVASKNEFIPLDAPVAGYETGVPGIVGPSPLFIIRAKYKDGVHPGKWVLGNTAWIPWGGAEHICTDFDIYTGPLKWGAVSGKKFPPNMVEAGREDNGAPLYVARAKFEKGLFVGKAGRHLSKGCCIGYMGKEYELDTFEVLVWE